MNRNPQKGRKSRASKVLLNEQRMHELGVSGDSLLNLYRSLSLSRLQSGKVASRFANKLESKLDRIEAAQILSGSKEANLPTRDSKGCFSIGKSCQSGEDYFISFSDLVKHLIICGASGSGKTNLITLIINALHRQVWMCFIDHKDEGGRILNHFSDTSYIPLNQQRWNCLRGSGKSQKDYIRYFAELLSRVMALANVTSNATQAKLLSLCADKDDLPSISDLCAIFHTIAEQERRNNLHTAARAFDDLAATMGQWASVRKGPFSFDEHALSIIPLKDLPTAYENLFITLLFKQFMDQASSLGHTSDISRMFILDEGRAFFGKEFETGTGSGRFNIQTQIMTKGRSYGFGICIGTQSAAMLQATVVDNAGTFIVLRTNSEQEAKFCCRRLGIEDRRYRELMELDTGVAWIVSPRCTQPVQIRIPYCDIGDYISDTEIARKMAPTWENWDAQSDFSKTKADNTAKMDFRKILGEDQEVDSPIPAAQDTSEQKSEEPETQQCADPSILAEPLAFLRSCSHNPEFGATAHYKALGWSAGKGNRVKNALVESKLLEVIRIKSPTGGRPKETYHLTHQGKEMI